MGSERGVIFWVFSMIIDPCWSLAKTSRAKGGCFSKQLETIIMNLVFPSNHMSQVAAWKQFLKQNYSKLTKPQWKCCFLGVFWWGLLPQWTNTLYKWIRLAACSFPGILVASQSSYCSQFSFYRSPKLLWPNALSRSGRRQGGQAFDGFWWTEMVGIWKVFNLPAVFFCQKIHLHFVNTHWFVEFPWVNV